MKKFVNKTNNQKEESVIKAINLVNDEETVSLAYFSSKEVTPKNSLIITDYSTLIQENNNIQGVEIDSDSKIYYANELGILEDESGNSLFSSKDISISDLFLSKETLDSAYDTTTVNPDDFVHSYYISRHYTLLSKILYSFNSINDFIDEDRIPLSIKVLDENGEEYIDKNTKKKKYRILLDPLLTSAVDKNNLKPYSIVVLIKDPLYKNLYLSYDKVEIISNNALSPVYYGFKENINPIPVFKRRIRRISCS